MAKLKKSKSHELVLSLISDYNQNQEILISKSNIRERLTSCIDPVQKKVLDKEFRSYFKIQIGCLTNLFYLLDAGKSIDELLNRRPKATKYSILATLKKIGIELVPCSLPNLQSTNCLSYQGSVLW